MTEKPLRIILVDDMESAKSDVTAGLNKIGIQVEISDYTPTERSKPLGGIQLPATQELNNYDLALVDLELFPPVEPHDYDPEDLRGGTEVLPFLRANSPWLPIIAYSRLFQNDTRHFLPIACGYGFDGHVTRAMFSAKWFSHPLWKTIYERACLQAKRRQLGDAFSGNEVVAIDPASIPSISQHPSLDKLIKSVFYFGSKIVLEQLPPGYSGADVFRVFVTARGETPGREGMWFFKVSKNPWELNREVQAHLRMMRSGLDFARSVPLLWHGLVVEDGAAGIAYQFANGTQQASELIAKVGVKDVIDQIAPMISQFYAGAEIDRGTLVTILNQLFPERGQLESIAKIIPNTQLAKLISNQIQFGGQGELAKSLRYLRCLIHGDLHLGNIMLGVTDVLIDFAHATSGPVAFDFACLVADALIRDESSRQSGIPHWRSMEQGSMADLYEVAKKINFGNEDEQLFDVLLAYRLGDALRFEVSESTKNWIKQQLTIFEPF